MIASGPGNTRAARAVFEAAAEPRAGSLSVADEGQLALRECW
jgi:hypothetical protein